MIIRPEPGSRLHELIAEYDNAKAAAAQAEERFTLIKDGIKAELSAVAPATETTILVTSDQLTRSLRLSASESWRLDARALKKDDPSLYVRYAKKSVTWVLRAVAAA